jgi:hypothetical protein
MSLTEELNYFFEKYGDEYSFVTINYTRELVTRIKTSDVLKEFLKENGISASVLLNEIVPYCDFKFKQYGDEKLDMKELHSMLNIIIFSNELERFIMNDDIEISSIGESGELYYRPNEVAADYFRLKYDMNMKEDVEFDFTILETIGENEKNIDDFDFGIN